jgi:hypothetical protein
MAIDKKLYIYINHIWIVMSGNTEKFPKYETAKKQV